jgi:SsrA-binding protein
MPRKEPKGARANNRISRGIKAHLKALSIADRYYHLRQSLTIQLTAHLGSDILLWKAMAIKTISLNRKAYHDYFIEDAVEAGLALKGTEVKSLRQGKVSLRDAYARAEHGELWLVNAHIAPYQAGNRYNHQPTRPRKLLLHREQIANLIGKGTKKGLTIVPLKLYFKNGIAKVELGLARGKRLYDKRAVLTHRQAQRQMEQALRY